MAQNLDVVLKLRDEATKQLGDVNREIKQVGTQMAVVGAASTAAFGFAIKGAANFEAEMTKVVTLVGVNADQVDEWKDDIKNLARDTGRGPQELAEALFVVTSAGIRGGEALDVLRQAAKASAIGLGDTKEIARAVTAAIQAYGIENLDAAEATDIMAATVREGNLEATELSGSLGRVIGIAAQVGVSFADVGAFVATFTRLGVSAEEAVTSLRGTLALMIKPTAEAREALGEVGLTFADLRANIAEQGLDQALIGLIQRFDGNVEALGKVIPNVRALSGVLGTAAAQGEAFAEIGTNIGDSLGLVDEAFIQTGATAAQQFAEVKAAFDVIIIEIGESLLPVVKQGLTGVGAFLGVWESLPEPLTRVAAQLGFAAGGISLVGGGMLIILPSLVSGVKTFRELAAASRFFRLSLVGFGVAAAAASVAIIALDTDTRNAVTGILADLGELEARGIVAITDALGASGLIDVTEPFRTRIKAIDLASASQANYNAALAESLGVFKTSTQAANELGLALEADRVDIEAVKVARLVAELLALEEKYTDVDGAQAGLVEGTVQSIAQMGLSKQALIDLNVTLTQARGFGELGIRIHDELILPLQDAEEEFGNLTEEVVEQGPNMRDAFLASLEPITAGLDLMGDSLDDLLPKPRETFGEWNDAIDEFAEAAGAFESNILAIFTALSEGNVEMADIIVATIADKGPIYAQQIATFFAENPQATLENFQQIAPTLASDWVTSAGHLIFQQGPEYKRRIDEAVINNIENVPQAWRTEFQTGGVQQVKNQADDVRNKLLAIPTRIHTSVTASFSPTGGLTAAQVMAIIASGGSFVPMQHGFHGVIDRPTLALIGEGNRAERVDVSPVGGGGGGGGGLTVVFAAGAFDGAFPSMVNTASPDDLVEAGEVIADIIRERMLSA